MASYDVFGELLTGKYAERDAADQAALLAQQQADRHRADLLRAQDATRAERGRAESARVTTRIERIEGFLAGCRLVADAIRDEVAPELVVHRNVLGFRGATLVEGWPLTEVNIAAVHEHNSNSVDGLSRSITSTRVPGHSAGMSGVVLDISGVPRQYSGEPRDTKRYEMEDDSIQRVVRMAGAHVLDLDARTMIDGNYDPEPLLARLAEMAMEYDVRPDTTGHTPRHAA